MPSYRLQALLDLRQAALRDAETSLAAAISRRADAVEQQGHRDEACATARARARQARHDATRGASGARAADLQALGRYHERLDALAAEAAEAATRHRREVLGEAEVAEEEARLTHRTARRDRELVDRHRQVEEAAGRRVTEARLEAALDDLVAARAAGRRPR